MVRLKTRVFTSGMLLHGGMALVLKRRPDDDTYPGLWDCVGGHFEKDETAEECMLRETMEESGLKVRIVKAGKLIEYRDEYGRSIAVPFLLESDSEQVLLSEHTEYEWVTPRLIRKLEAVPGLKLMLDDFDL